MDIVSLVRDTMPFENGAYGQRLVPWAPLNAPFEGAWVVVPAHGATGVHDHHEYEIFIAMKGEAEVETGGERRPFKAGDIEVHQPGVPHRGDQRERRGLRVLRDLVGHRHVRGVPQEARGERAMTERPTVIIAGPPTANGDLHVGHVAGPYVGATCTRATCGPPAGRWCGPRAPTTPRRTW